MVLSSSLMNCFPKYMHRRNLFAEEPGGFQRTLCPICSEASHQGNLSFPVHSLKTELAGKRALVSSTNPEYRLKGSVRHLQTIPWVTIGMSEF